MKKTSLMLYVAVAGLPLALAGTSRGQFQVNTGNALDANNQAGAGGSNVPVSAYTLPQPLYNGNQIVTGNVTQGRNFRDAVGYTDPNALRTNVVGVGVDNFTRSSVGVPRPYQPSVPAYVAPRAFLGETQAARVPPGFALNRYAGAYVAQSPQRPTLSNSTQINVLPADGLNPRDMGMAQPTRADTLVSGGPLYTTEPLYTPPLSETYGSAGYGSYPRFRSPDSLRISDRALEQMRLELNQTMSGRFDPAQPGGGLQQQQQPLGQPLQQQQQQNEPIGLTAQSLSGQSLSTPPTTPQQGVVINNEALPNRLGAPLPGTEAAAGALVPAARQSSQYAQLQQRLNQFEAGRKPGAAAAAGQATAGGATAGGATPAPTAAGRGAGGAAGGSAAAGGNGTAGGLGAGAGGGVGAGAPSATATDRGAGAARRPGATADRGTGADRGPAYPPSVPRVAPLDVRSLAAGVQAKGLRDLMTDAERLTREGKFAGALERYDAAEAVAPNNPLVWLGRAHAQLGAGYYARAERDLRSALTSDRALLMGRYDLEYFLGEARLAAVVQDLKDVAKAEKGDARTPFLLAYIAYNTGNKDRAAEYLALAEQRAGGADPFFRTVRDHWDLPKGKDKSADPG
jgi:tetratricopeptide (TPR) repeat protein